MQEAAVNRSLPVHAGTHLRCMCVLGPRPPSQAPKPDPAITAFRAQASFFLSTTPRLHAHASTPTPATVGLACVHHPHALPTANTQQCIRKSGVGYAPRRTPATAETATRTHPADLDDSFVSSSPLAMHESTFVKNCLGTACARRRCSRAPLGSPGRRRGDPSCQRRTRAPVLLERNG